MENFAKIGIDWWGILVYLVNYGIVFWILSKTILPGIKKAIVDRKNTIRHNLEEAETLRSQLETNMKESEAEKQKFLAEVKLEKEKFQIEMSQKQEALVTELEATRAKMLEKARADIEREKEELIVEAEKRIVAMMKGVLLSVLSTDVPEATIASSVARSWDAQKQSFLGKK